MGWGYYSIDISIDSPDIMSEQESVHGIQLQHLFALRITLGRFCMHCVVHCIHQQSLGHGMDEVMDPGDDPTRVSWSIRVGSVAGSRKRVPFSVFSIRCAPFLVSPEFGSARGAATCGPRAPSFGIGFRCS